MKCIINGRILRPDGITDGCALVFDRRIRRIVRDVPEEMAPEDIIDAKGNYVSPGLIDVHCHGAMGWDTSNADPEELQKLSEYKAKHGVTAWLPTTMTMDWPVLEKCFSAVRSAMRKSGGKDWYGARVLGCHAEGPFISERRKGAQDARYIQKPDIEKLRPWANVVRLMTVAPEVEGALPFIREARNLGVTISMGHTNATVAEAIQGIEAGVTHMTHTFNAMSPLTHREPGASGAALNDDRVYCELIADTYHIHPMVFPMMAKLKRDRLILITDSIKCAGLPDGSYDLWGNSVVVKGISCKLEDGTIAGSVLTMDRAVQNFMHFTDQPIWRVVNMASLYPARSIGEDAHVGALLPGKKADIIIVDEEFNIIHTFVGGRCVYSREKT